MSIVYIGPSISGRTSIEVLSGETVTFECIPSIPNLQLHWTYQLDGSNDTFTVTADNIFRTKFLNRSSLLHQLILPISAVSDTGSYHCIATDDTGLDKFLYLDVSSGK